MKYDWRPPVGVPALQPLFQDKSLEEVGLGDALRHAGLTYIEHHPFAVVEATVLDTWRMAELSGLHQSQLTAQDAGYGKRLAELGMAAFWLVALLAIAGLCTKRARRVPWGFWLAPVMLWIVTAPFLGDSRLRSPLDPFFIVAAALAVVEGWERFARPRVSARRSVETSSPDIERPVETTVA